MYVSSKRGVEDDTSGTSGTESQKSVDNVGSQPPTDRTNASPSTLCCTPYLCPSLCRFNHKVPLAVNNRDILLSPPSQ